MSISPAPPRPLAPEDDAAGRREQAARRRAGPGSAASGAAHDHGEVIAAALVRVATPALAGRPVPGDGPGRLGVVLQTVSAVSWLSAGRARGAA